LVTPHDLFRKTVVTLTVAAFAASAFPCGAYAACGGAEPAYGEPKAADVTASAADGRMNADTETPRIASLADTTTTSAAWSKCTVEAPQTAQAGADFKIRITGDRQDEKGKYDGETKFVPSSWEIRGDPFGNYVSEKPFTAPYESVVNLKNAGAYTISAKYKSFTFTPDVGWTEDAVDFEYVKTTTVSVPLTVRFDARGGSISISSGQYDLTEKCGVFPSASRRKYRFIGWYRTRNGESADLIGKDDSVAILNTSKTASVTLYAHYGKSVKVRFNANGGKVKKKSKRVTYVTAYEKKAYGNLPRPTRRGYHFAGWYTKKKGGRYVSAYSDVRSRKNLTLYAHWVR
jgi:uncharacterized repeat protein (TIGR02543 family)